MNKKEDTEDDGRMGPQEKLKKAERAWEVR
jgi:hypothetical protein